MKLPDLEKLFCEILCGLALMAIALPSLSLGIGYTIKESIEYLMAHFAEILVFGYFLGVLTDAVGFALGEWFLDALLLGKRQVPVNRNAFWQTVPDHVLAYRDRQWTYFSTYRNLLVVLIPNAYAWCAWAFPVMGKFFGMALFLGFTGLGIALFYASRFCLIHYLQVMAAFQEKLERKTLS